MKFPGKIVWIAGASSGIGEELVYAFIKEGARVIASAPFEDELSRVRTNCGQDAAMCDILPLDMLRSELFAEMVQETVKKFGKIDILVNVAGISQRALAGETGIDTVRKIMEINFFGTIALSREVLLQMKKQGSGRIAVVTSVAGKFGAPLRSSYSASKHALHGYFESLQAELAGSDIKVTLLVPGRVNTEISKNALKGDGSVWDRMDKGLAGGISIEKAVRIMLKAIYREKKEVVFGGKIILMVYFRRFCPCLYRWIISRVEPT